MAMSSPSYSDVASQLRGAIETLAREILPDGRREGREWRGTGPDGGKWCVVLSGSKAGVFLNTGEGLAGDPLELIRYGRCNGDKRAAYEWALAWLGYGGADRPADAPRRPVAPRQPPRDDTEKIQGAARAMFINAKPFAWDNPAGLYLIARGITPGAITWPLRALRFAPSIYHPSGRHMPAMIAAVIEPSSGKFVATHRTWLRQDGATWRKASERPSKASLGPVLGGVIALSRGPTGKTLPKAEAPDAALIAEGIENALSVAPGFPERRALAGISSGNIPAIDLPAGITDVMLIRDRDGENDAVRASVQRALSRWIDEGRTTNVWEPPPGFKDANDWLNYAWEGEQHANRA
jgi:hypothetical protein